MVKARKYVLHQQFDGFPKREDLRIVEEELPPLKDGEFLGQAVYISVDPYQRAYAPRQALGSTMLGEQIVKVIESKSKDIPVGSYVQGPFGWRDYTIASDKPGEFPGWPQPKLVPDLQGLPLSLALGVLGMPGATSYFGFLEICKPKAGETVVVTGAGGAVGSHVGQIAKIKGAYVIGVTGSDEKGKILVEKYGFDRYINYKKPDFDKTLAEYAPKGVDCYFDNVGGELSSAIINKMNLFGRVSVCGSISAYNSKGSYPLAPVIQPLIVMNQLKVEGFIVWRWADRYSEAVQQNIKWIKEGKLKYDETVTEGFENTFDAFVNMLQGGNFGKAIVKV